MRSALRRLGVLVLTLTTAAVLSANVFPSPVTPEIAASPATIGPAIHSQAMGHAAWNGDITFAAWSDTRGVGVHLFGARIAGDGDILDPLGLDLGSLNPPEDVVWNGTSFVVITSDPKTSKVVLVFVSPDGVVTGRRGEDIPGWPMLYSGASGRGASVRMMFANFGQGTVTTTVVDAIGDIVGTSALTDPRLASPFVIGSDDAGFLILGSVLASPTSPPDVPIVATRFDRSGQPGSTIVTNIPPPVSWGFSSAIASNGNGFLYVRQSSDGGEQAFALDVNGLFAGYSYTLATPVRSLMNTAYRPAVQWIGNEYVVAWGTTFSYMSSYVSISTITPEAKTASTRVARDVQGVVNDVSLVVAPQPLLLSSTRAFNGEDYDLYIQRVTGPADAGAARLLTTTATTQAVASVATARSGYAIAWVELASDRYFRGYVRRFAYGGQPIDSEPILVFEVLLPPVGADALLRVVSDGDRFAVVWNDGTRMLLRRLSLVPDEWSDAAPVELTKGPQAPYAAAVGSNGDGALMAVTATCSDGISMCLATQRIAMTGDPLPSPAVVVASGVRPFEPALASNGSDYLLVWTNANFICPFECPAAPSKILGVRVRGDGTAIDASPIVILGGEDRYASSPSIAWNGGRYAVVWTDSTGGVSVARAATVTIAGAVGDVGSTGTGTLLQSDSRFARIVAFDDAFALITDTKDGIWSGAAFCAVCPLAEVESLTPTPLFAPVVSQQMSWFPGVKAAGWGSSMILAYGRPEASAGSVFRVFSRMHAQLPPRRRVVAR